ncbi:hypothetical protein B0O80DRAFT_454297 [Mortierella sp. GBAus27b]|nr:hypothetical protein B0O80DRAFT_454297 [Mortierella sp. GBAus27b]
MDQQTSTGTPTLLSALSTYSLWVVTLYVWQGLINRTTIDNISLEDFLQEQHTLSRSPSFPSALTRYGPWIRELPDPENLLQCLQPPCGTIQRQQTPNGIDKEPTALNLMRHLYKRCPAREIELLELNTEDLQSDDYCNAIAEMVVPNVRHFRLSNKGHRRLETWRLKYILDHCSNKLEELVLDVVLSFKGDVLEEEEGKEEKDQEPKSWTRLKQLSLLDFNRKPASMDFCSWLWKRCDHVEKLQVDNIYGTTRSLAAGMLKHMSNLREIRLGIRWLYNLPDDEIAMLLSGSRKGWRVVELRRIERFGKASRRALSEHFSSLEQLLVDGSQGFTDHDMIQVLTSCPHLHTLIDTDSIRLDANRFIDRDPIVAHFRTWACESTLKVLSIVIRGIPRPDLMTNGSNVEIDHDQQQEVQSQVYDRLARLVNLEVLRLGYVPAGGSSSRNDAIQKDCLAMSLESGLWKLEGLKSLRELGVARMKVKVGVKEVQWMAEHWPQLRAIQGLDRRRDEAVVEAVKWMRRHRPEIAIKAK